MKATISGRLAYKSTFKCNMIMHKRRIKRIIMLNIPISSREAPSDFIHQLDPEFNCHDEYN